MSIGNGAVTGDRSARGGLRGAVVTVGAAPILLLLVTVFGYTPVQPLVLAVAGVLVGGAGLAYGDRRPAALTVWAVWIVAALVLFVRYVAAGTQTKDSLGPDVMAFLAGLAIVYYLNLWTLRGVWRPGVAAAHRRGDGAGTCGALVSLAAVPLLVAAFFIAVGQQILPLLVAVGGVGAAVVCLAVGDRRPGALALWALLAVGTGAVYLSYVVTGMSLRDTLGLELVPGLAVVLLIFAVNLNTIVRAVAGSAATVPPAR